METNDGVTADAVALQCHYLFLIFYYSKSLQDSMKKLHFGDCSLKDIFSRKIEIGKEGCYMHLLVLFYLDLHILLRVMFVISVIVLLTEKKSNDSFV